MIPFLLERGFAQHSLSNEDAKNRELRVGFPFGYMKRRNGALLELVEVQLDKHGMPKFVLNFGAVPPEGIVLPWVRLSQEDATVSALPDGLRLYRRPRLLVWFALPWLPTNRQRRAVKAVDRAIALYPEMEAWFSTRSMGPHLRPIGFRMEG
jgi:hypothetical protein